MQNSKNPNLVPIGEGFGFLLYLDYPKIRHAAKHFYEFAACPVRKMCRSKMLLHAHYWLFVFATLTAIINSGTVIGNEHTQ